MGLGNSSLAAPDPPRKVDLVKLCTKSLTLLEFEQLQSDCSISNLKMSYRSIKGFTAQADYFRQVDSGENGHKDQPFLLDWV